MCRRGITVQGRPVILAGSVMASDGGYPITDSLLSEAAAQQWLHL